MAKSSLEKAIEKERRDAKRLANKQLQEQRRQARQEYTHQIAMGVINGQPIIGGMRIMDASSEEILRFILSAYDGNENREVRGNKTLFPTVYQSSLPLEFEKLKMYGIVAYSFINVVDSWELTLSPKGLTYFEDKIHAEEKEKEMQKSSINIEQIVASGSNIILGNVVDSTISIDRSIQNIENDIVHKAGEDADDLKELLGEVKELIENIQESHFVPKNKKLFERLSNHLEKHGWFYGEIVGLIGAAIMQMIK